MYGAFVTRALNISFVLLKVPATITGFENDKTSIFRTYLVPS